MRFLFTVAALALAASAAQARPLAFSTDMPTSGVLVIPLASASDLPVRATGLDSALRAAVERALATSKFEFKAGATLSLRSLGGYDEIVVVGARPQRSGALTTPELRRIGGAAAQATLKADSPVAFAAAGLGEIGRAHV